MYYDDQAVAKMLAFVLWQRQGNNGAREVSSLETITVYLSPHTRKFLDDYVLEYEHVQDPSQIIVRLIPSAEGLEHRNVVTRAIHEF